MLGWFRMMTARAPAPRARAIRFVLAVLLALMATAAARAADTGVGGQFLLLSDIHFNPMANPAVVDRLAAAEPADWSAIFAGVPDKSFGRYGADTSWQLLRSALAQIKAVLPHPAFVLITGDFLAHHFRDQFDAAAHDHSDAAYRRFVDHTMRFLALQLERSFSGAPILPALGNNDDICGDFRLQPEGPFLADMLPVVRGLADGGKPELGPAWTSLGNYSAAVPGLSGVRLVFANTVFLSRRYRNACGPPGGADPGQATLAWLATELAAARQAHQRVWLAYHVPPGIDGFATWRLGSCPDHIIPMWDKAYAEPLYTLLRHYADTIAASFAGHTHMDDFRLIGDAGGNFAFALITPAISPIFGQNPAFRTVAYNAEGGILDQTTYELANLAQAGAGVPAKWRPEYTFSREWRLPRVDLASLEQLYARITTVPEDRERWRRLFAVSNPGYWTSNPGGADEIRAFACATGHVSVAEYRQCWCGLGK